MVPWLGFFKREYLTKHNLLFPEGIAYEEDQLFFLEALICDQKCRIYQSDLEFYAYRKRDGSATKTPTLKQVQDVNLRGGKRKYAIKEVLTFFECQKGCEEIYLFFFLPAYIYLWENQYPK